MSYEKRQQGEIAAPVRQIYVKHIKPLMTEEDVGKFVAIDVDTGDYELAQEVTEALHRLRQRHPDASLTAQKVGYRTPFSFVPRRPDDV